MLKYVWPYMDTDDIPFFEAFKKQFSADEQKLLKETLTTFEMPATVSAATPKPTPKQ